MSDLKDRLAIATAGFANIVNRKGEMIVGDGEQAAHLELGTDGFVLTADNTAPLGVRWTVGGGGGIADVLGADGITVDGGATKTVHNNLVTGTPVSNVVAIVPNVNSDASFRMDTDGSVTLTTGDQGAGLEALTLHGGLATLHGDSGARVDGGGNNTDVTNSSGSFMRVQGNGSLLMQVTAVNRDIQIATGGGGTDVSVEANRALSLIADGGNLTITQNSANPLRLETPGGGDINIAGGAAVNIDGTGLTQITGSGVRVASNPASQLVLASGANTLIAAGGNLQATAGGNFSFIANGGSNGSFIATTDGTGDITLTSADAFTVNAAGNAHITGNDALFLGTGAMAIKGGSGATVDITTQGTGDLNLNANHDLIGTVGRNFAVDAAGSSGVSISASHATGPVNITSNNQNVNLAAGSIDGSGAVRIQTGTVSATRLFQIFDGAGSGQQAGAIAPSGGVVVDANMRAAFGTLLTYLFNWGWISNPTP